MKILIITAKYPALKCGVGTYTSFLFNSLRKVEPNIKVITSSRVKKKNKAIVGLISNSSLYSFIKIKNFVAEWKQKIIHFQYTPTAFKNLMVIFLLYFFFFTKKKVIFTWHELFYKKSYIFYFLISVAKPQIIVVRKDFKKKLNRFAKIVVPKINFIPSSVTLDYKKNYSEKNLRESLLPQKYKRLFIFYGYIFPHKNIELITKIINFETDYVVISSYFDKNNKYSAQVLNFLKKDEFKKNFLIKYIDDSMLGHVLRVVDAIILPFNVEIGSWNTTINNAINSKSFTLTNSIIRRGYDPQNNIYYAKFNNSDEMKRALNKYSAKKNKDNICINKWSLIAKKHLQLYNQICKN